MSPPSTPISSPPRSPVLPPGAPRPNRFRDAIRPSVEMEQNIRGSINRYRGSIITLVAQDFEKKTGHKLNVKQKQKTAVSADSQTSASVPPVTAEPKNRRETIAAGTQQVVYGSAEWHAANDGFVEMSAAEKEAERKFWS
ncbi:uncharacterized protein EAF02_005093 [Botrytis sinoallii]|uniref:uncharacterized protein n=1 Tax=Botrytis sinoallii TaxID=1463999 RepID=UPI001902A031|nr:uncharacterized protein EAF02_005093 [Botrytis sinoallii]KAF7884757.1 hypothetical protein EAF02_005093 [Botrytis sinoallii]